MDEKTSKYLDNRSFSLYPSSESGYVLVFTADFYEEFTYRSILGNLGYQIVSEDNLASAKNILTEKSFEFIIVDLQDANENGFRFLDYFFSIPDLKGTPVYVNRPNFGPPERMKQLRRYKRLRVLENDRLLLSELFFGDLKLNGMGENYAG